MGESSTDAHGKRHHPARSGPNVSARVDFEQHRMPSGGTVFYRDADHSYWLSIEQKADDWKGKDRLTGVSTVSGPFDFKPDLLINWSARTTREGVCEVYHESIAGVEDGLDLDLSWLASPESIKKALSDRGVSHDNVRDDAADRGTKVHKHALYALAQGKMLAEHDKLNEVEQGYARGIEECWLEHDPETLQAEQVVMDASLLVAGRFDWRGRFRRQCGRPWCACMEMVRGGVAMLDAKTSGFIPLKHHVQVAGYMHCTSSSGFGYCDMGMILQVGPDGGWQLIPCRATRKDFKAAVKVYRRAAHIQKLARADQREQAAA